MEFVNYIGKPSFTTRYNVIEGTQQRFCETCLNQDSNITSECESANHTGQNVSHQHFENLFIDNGTTNGEMGRENNFSKLRPTWQPTRNDMVDMVNMWAVHILPECILSCFMIFFLCQGISCATRNTASRNTLTTFVLYM